MDRTYKPALVRVLTWPDRGAPSQRNIPAPQSHGVPSDSSPSTAVPRTDGRADRDEPASTAVPAGIHPSTPTQRPAARRRRYGVQHANPGHFGTLILSYAFQKFIQNSATRFNSCKFTRNSGTTRLRAAALARVRPPRVDKKGVPALVPCNNSY